MGYGLESANRLNLEAAILRVIAILVWAKFHRLADPIIGAPQAEEVAETCLAAIENDEASTRLRVALNS
jgi:hypothetical protein